MHAKFLLAHLKAAVSWFRDTAILGLILYGALAFTTTTIQAQETDFTVEPVQSTGFIALILPSKAKAFKSVSDTIRAGVLAAERVHGGADIPLVRAYPTDEKEENVILAYLQAQQDGAQAVIGPLTKSAINYLSDSTTLTIPVLALNSFDETTLLQPNLYSFSLSVEAEAAQVAQLIHKNQLMRPVVLQVGDALSQRMAQGFIQEWKKATGNEAQVITVADARHDGAQLREQIAQLDADVIFLAMDGKSARYIRPYLGNDMAIYATSQVDSGRLGRTALVDLIGIRYVDMPWLGMPQSEGYDLYNRTRSNAYDLERLFAFGVDAWRIASVLAKDTQPTFSIDGVTGQLTMGPDRVVVRDMMLRTMALEK
ncbi:penicillin-binding protein activator [Deefgea piscis]|uniref:penicillin-binding protein activator n=1 Tax=Deefgea piscis TaxID=2739061 RepID=UPI001C7E309D|nr:penicillin-binding protein activator [Deefgea piscis]QZA80611.1 penicillin-binding protein activator [Deefgea piscis]